MSVLEWKKLNFFRLIPEADHKKVKQSVKAKITACLSNSVYKVFCDASGNVHIFFRGWESISFRASNSSILFAALATECNALVTLSKADFRNDSILKVWDLTKLTKRTGAPCIATATIPSQSNATAMNVSYKGPSCICVAVGFEGGDISLFKGSIRDFSAGFRTFPISTNRITGIEFKQRNSKNPVVFVCTYAGVFCFNLTDGYDVRETLIALDTRPEPVRCCALKIGEEDQYFIVGRDDAVYCYTTDGRGPCYAIEGQKKHIAKYGYYLLIVINNSVFPSQKYTLIIIDLCHKIIVFNKTMESISGIIFENNNCFILTDSNLLYALYEKDVNTKLELLSKKHLYDICLRLLEHENCDENRRADILKLYGDHLYLKGDFAGAIERYIQTIGVIQPYCIIRKFLDSKSVVYLLEYMEALLKTDIATEQHVQLFLNCNSRIRLPVKLREFLACVEKENEPYKDVYCSLSEGISHNLHGKDSGDTKNRIYDASITTFLNLIDNISESEKFLHRLSENQIYSFFKEHSQVLMRCYPQNTTEILKSICGKKSLHPEDNHNLIKSPELLIPLFVEHQSYCVDFLEHVISEVSNCKEIIYTYLFALYLRDWESKKDNVKKLVKFLEDYHTKYDANHILILCKLYTFWDGVLYFLKNNDLYNLSIQYFIQSGDFNNIFSSCKSPKLSIQSLCNIDWSSEGSIPLIKYTLNENLTDKIKSPLQIFQNISEIPKLRVSHVKEFYSQELIELTNVFENDSKNVNTLANELNQLQQLLRNFQYKAIEVRCHICSICKMQIKHPAVYFLCQHSFHKHCLSLYSEDNAQCFACNSQFNEKTNDKADNNQNRITNSSQAKHYLAFVVQFLEKGIMNDLLLLNAKIQNRQFANNPFEISSEVHPITTSPFYTNKKTVSTNPFEDEEGDTFHVQKHYDANLNPFEEQWN